jgi:dTMP kinase
MFLTLEGIEGSGKSTLLSGLSDRLRSRGREIFVTREPGGTPVGDAVRALFLDRGVSIAPLTEALLVNAARAQHVVERIVPELALGRMVLCDRFVDSTIAYQGYGRGVDPTVLRALCDAATGGLVPDLTFVLDVPVETSRRRTGARGTAADRLEAEDDGFHERVRAGFLELARGPRYRVLDGELAPQELLERALREIDACRSGELTA